MELSIVTTLYCSENFIEEFYKRASSAAQKLSNNYEIIFVNDGSPDSSLDTAILLNEKDKRVKVIDLSRNFGHHLAMMTGLAHAQGDLVFLIDCDLEEEPELLDNFNQVMKDKDADVVYGVQDTRKGSIFERVTGKLFFSLFNMLSSYPVPANIVTARLMKKRYVESLVEHKDKEIFLAGLWAITGYKQIPLTIKKLNKGSTTYSFARKISILINAITSFSNRPLLHVFYLGCVIMFFSFTSALFLIIRRLVFGIYLTGWPSLIVSIWMLGGMTIFCIGIIGIYLSKIFTETKERPYTVIKKVYAGKEERELKPNP